MWMSATAQESYVASRFYEGLPHWAEEVTVQDLIWALIPAPVPRTGQTESYATGDDGDLQLGVPWPNPRFSDNANGTVTDNFTGLIWLKNADCGGMMNWATAISYCNSLGNGQCGLSDGSSPGDWRLPNVQELQSLCNYGFDLPALSNAAGTAKWTEGDPFSGVQGDLYWSSTTEASSNGSAWRMYLATGYVDHFYKSHSHYVWPVRGGRLGESKVVFPYFWVDLSNSAWQGFIFCKSILW